MGTWKNCPLAYDQEDKFGLDFSTIPKDNTDRTQQCMIEDIHESDQEIWSPILKIEPIILRYQFDTSWLRFLGQNQFLWKYARGITHNYFECFDCWDQIFCWEICHAKSENHSQKSSFKHVCNNCFSFPEQGGDACSKWGISLASEIFTRADLARRKYKITYIKQHFQNLLFPFFVGKISCLASEIVNMGTWNLCCTQTINYICYDTLRPVIMANNSAAVAPNQSEQHDNAWEESESQTESRIGKSFSYHPSDINENPDLDEVIIDESQVQDGSSQQQGSVLTSVCSTPHQEQSELAGFTAYLTDRSAKAIFDHQIRQLQQAMEDQEHTFENITYERECEEPLSVKYHGMLQNGLYHGLGTFISPNGARYIGSWHEGKQVDFGKEVWPDGTIFYGNYKEGRKNGKGFFKWFNRSKYEGNFKNDEQHGMGTYTYPDGRTYKGQWHNGKKHGKGAFTWPDGRQYHGDYENDLKSGYGIYQWKNGALFEGHWQHGKQHGRGRYVNSQRNETEGEWRRGKRIKNVLSYK